MDEQQSGTNGISPFDGKSVLDCGSNYTNLHTVHKRVHAKQMKCEYALWIMPVLIPGFDIVL